MTPLLSFSSLDLKRLYRQKKEALFAASLLVLAVSGLWMLLQPPTFQVEASLQTGKSDSASSLSALFFSEQARAPVPMRAILSSQKVVRKAIEELGWQARLPPESRWLRPLRHLQHLLGLEVPDPTLPLFRKCRYEGERPQKRFLRFLSDTTFEILGEKKVSLGSGLVGESQNLGGFSFTLPAKPSLFQIGTAYPFTLLPAIDVIREAQKHLSIKPSHIEKSVLQLTFSHLNRHEAPFFLNTLIDSSEVALQEETHHFVGKQLGYLRARQEELAKSLEEELNEHAESLKLAVRDQGLIAAFEPLESKSTPYDALLSRLLEVELELSKLPPLPEGSLSELPGLDLASAKSLYIDYAKTLQNLEADLKQIADLKVRLQDPESHLSSLGYIALDPVTQEMVNSAKELDLQHQDVVNRSERDRLRLQDALTTKKGFILSHLGELTTLKENHRFRTQEKLRSMEKALTSLLAQEKKALEERLKASYQNLEKVPAKWSLSDKLKFRTTLTKKALEALTTLLESKAWDKAIQGSDSTALDLAFPPLYPSQLPLFFLPASLALLTFILTYLYFFLRAIPEGIPDVPPINVKETLRRFYEKHLTSSHHYALLRALLPRSQSAGPPHS